LSGPLFNLTASFKETITGGTGKNAGATGTETGTLHGQSFEIDPADNSLAWSEVSFTGTITTP
jgi:hypothetical protein